MQQSNNPNLYKGAIVSGLLNAIINGVINWFQVKGHVEVFLTVDSISAPEHTVMGSAILLALLLSVIIATIGWFSLKQNKVPFFPAAFFLILKNAFFLFGIFITLALLLQRYAGSITVSAITGAIIVGVVAGIVAGVTDYLTKKQLTNNNK